MAQQQIITKPYIEELLDADSLFVNHGDTLRQIKKNKTGFATEEDLEETVAEINAQVFYTAMMTDTLLEE